MAKRPPPFTTLAIGEEDPLPPTIREGEETQPPEEPPTPTAKKGEDEPQKRGSAVPHDNPLGAF